MFTISAVTFSSPNTILYLTSTIVNCSGNALIGNVSDFSLWNGDQIIKSNYSHSEGNNTFTLWENSHAEGYKSIALTPNSHAEGGDQLNNIPGGYTIGVGSHAEGVLTTSFGGWSHAEGYQTISYGNGSHSEGKLTTALGNFSHSEGLQTTASGYYSHAEGYKTISSGIGSHAEGGDQLNDLAGGYAIGVGSHAEGINTTSIGIGSHTEGRSTTASGYGSHTEGSLTTASAYYSHAEGRETTASGDYSHTEGYKTIATGRSSHAEGGDQINNIPGGYALGTGSHAEGINTQTGKYGAYLSNPIVNGVITLNSSYGNVTSGFTSGNTVVIDDRYFNNDIGRSNYTISAVTFSSPNTILYLTSTIVYCSGNAIIGNLSDFTLWNGDQIIRGDYSHAQGELTWSIGIGSNTKGALNTASGYHSHAEGGETHSIGSGSHSEGRTTTSVGSFSHAEGNATTASGGYSHAEGRQTAAIGIYSHAEGGSTTALGEYSHAEGRETMTSGNYSHAEGYLSTTVGSYSHVEGERTTAFGRSSHTEGIGTITVGDYQHVQGMWNVTGDTTQGAFIVGNGSDNNNRSNLIFAAGNQVNISGKTTTTNFRMTSGATNGYVLTSDNDGNASWKISEVVGNYLPLSGGTVSGGTSFTSGLSANTIYITTTPTTDTQTTTQYLTRDSSTGQIKSKTIPGPTVYGLFAQTGNSTTISGTTSELSLIDGGIGTLSVPENGFNIGDSFRADFGGLMSSKQNDDIRIRIKSGSVVLADSGLQNMDAGTDDVWQLSVNFTIRKIGGPTQAEIVTLGVFHTTKQSNGTQTGFAFNTVNYTTFDTTIPNQLDVTVQFSSTDSLNKIYSDIFILNKIY